VLKCVYSVCLRCVCVFEVLLKDFFEVFEMCFGVDRVVWKDL
jgi:hypothetical protein